MERGWIANSTIMTSYINWCAAHRYDPKKAKGVAQALSAYGIENGVNKRVVDEHEQRQQKMAHGVRGLSVS